MKYYFLLQTNPWKKQERYIATRIKAIFGDEVNIYIPQVKVHKDKETFVQRRLAPGYCFIVETPIPLDEGENFYKVKSIQGVYGIKRLFNEDIKQLDVLKSNLENYVEDSDLQREVKPGDVVEVKHGPFFGYAGKVIEIKKDRVKISLRIFNRETVVELPKKDVSI